MAGFLPFFATSASDPLDRFGSTFDKARRRAKLFYVNVFMTTADLIYREAGCRMSRSFLTAFCQSTPDAYFFRLWAMRRSCSVPSARALVYHSSSAQADQLAYRRHGASSDWVY